MCTAAREILAILASEVDCERLFNEGRDLLGITTIHYKRGDDENYDAIKGSVKVEERDGEHSKIDYKWS